MTVVAYDMTFGFFDIRTVDTVIKQVEVKVYTVTNIYFLRLSELYGR